MTYNEEYVAVMALTNILTGLHVLATLDCINNSVLLNAHTVLIENSIVTIAAELTDPESTTGGIGSNILLAAQQLVENCNKYKSKDEAIKQTAIDALRKLAGKLQLEEIEVAHQKKNEPC